VSPKKREQNEKLREMRRLQILDAALSAYIEKGYNGTDMDEVAAGAGLAKGLVYYYFKNKQELFRAVFDWAMGFLMEANQEAVASTAGLNPVERLARYTQAVFALAEKDPRVLKFAMRLPFDAYVVFGPTEWKKGFARANLHRDALASLISDIAAAGDIPRTDPVLAANNFWAVFIANCYSLTAMVGVQSTAVGAKTRSRQIGDALAFCFQGLGLPHASWGKYFEGMEEKS
jgi:TetR/AcrR family transcriptional regulator